MSAIGIDLSLTSTGFCAIDDGTISVRRVRSQGARSATLRDRAERLQGLAEGLRDACLAWDASLVAIEGPAINSKTGHMHDRSGLWWLVVLAMSDANIAVVEIAPTQVKKYATGKGNASKDAVLAAVVRRYPQIEINGNDEADALILAAMASRFLGKPIEDSLPQLHLETMEKVAWPVERPLVV